jgi:phosphoribosylformimino-5-aminoimidazole carboxamide ribotide isomerase
VQTGGGIRCADDVLRILDAGAARVVVGSLAVREPDTVAGWIARFGAERITVALDTRFTDAAWRLPLHGWTETSGRTLDELAGLYGEAGLRHVLCTDIDRDGMLTGPNLELYAHLVSRVPDVAVQASGGVRDAADIAAARAVGCGGAILGKALLEARINLKDALAC